MADNHTPDAAALLARVDRFDVRASNCLNAARNLVVCDAVGELSDGRFVKYSDFDALATALRAALADQRRWEWLERQVDGVHVESHYYGESMGGAKTATVFTFKCEHKGNTIRAAIDAAMSADGGNG